LRGQLAARNFTGNQAIDLRLDVAGALEGCALEPVEPSAPPPCSEELMSLKAEDSALWSDELMLPELTSDFSSACSN
jgi:hypothetical protein